MSFPLHQVSEKLYRSPQPEFEDFLMLKGRGIAAVVNLREEAPESSFYSKQAGLNYLFVPVVDWSLPRLEQVDEFLDFVETSGPVLVHCQAGVGRTGTFVACYRVKQGMEVEEALELTNSETPMPGVTMNKIQRDFVRNWAKENSVSG